MLRLDSILPHLDDEAEGHEAILLIPDAVYTNKFLIVSDLVDVTTSRVIICIIAVNFVSILVEERHSADTKTIKPRLDFLDWSLLVEVDCFGFVLTFTSRIEEWRLLIGRRSALHR